LKPIKGDSVFNQIKTITLASVALINNNYVVYDSLILQLKDSLFYYNNLQVSLNKWRKKATIKTKNPIIAAGLAAMVPGLGKVYAGKPYDGLSTFLTHVPLGFVIWESYNNAGVNSARFITFTSITSLFYVGNILASYHYIYKNRKEEKIDRKNEILLQCNIMLRNYYN
jgi:TM2 domain-containing membrane protein YozV